MITLIANAKINLFLDIINKRPDGYHNLETVMQSIDLSDILTVELADEISVECSDPTVPQNEGNICHKAAELFYALFAKKGGAEIFIEKRIPHGAGLGGGSADAAAVLIGLNALHGKPFDEKILLKLGAKVGADVPFCMTGGQKLCGGTGNAMENTKEFDWRDYLIVKPSFSCDTKKAYEMYDITPVLRREQDGGVYNVFRALYGNAELNDTVEKLERLGAEAAELTGSGSAVFGAFDDRKAAINAAKAFPNCFTAVCRPVSRGVVLIDRII